MPLTKQKTRWWYALAAGIGGIALFILVCLQEGLPPVSEVKIYLWPFGSLALLVGAAFRLIRFYRLEPAARGGWQLSLGELVVLMLLLGTTLTIFQAADPERFLYLGLPITFSAGALILFGLLAAKRAGHEHSRSSIFYALGVATRLYGALGVGGLGVCILVVTFLNPGYFFRFLAYAFFLSSDFPSMEAWLYYSLRAGWIAFTLSFLFHWFADEIKSGLSKSPPAP